MNKTILLKGNGGHEHALIGDFIVTEKQSGELESFSKIDVKQECHLKHQTPSGGAGEHETLVVKPGKYITGEQVEYNPFDNKLSRIWD